MKDKISMTSGARVTRPQVTRGQVLAFFMTRPAPIGAQKDLTCDPTRQTCHNLPAGYPWAVQVWEASKAEILFTYN